MDQGLVKDDEKAKWECCVEAMSATLEDVGRAVRVSAVCVVHDDSGLTEQPINGDLVFTQSVTHTLHY